MKSLALLGAALAIGIGAAHSYLGERFVLTRLFRGPDLPHLFGSDVFTRRTLRFAWHLTTVAWCGFAWVLVLLARQPSAREVGTAVAGTFAASALLTFVGSRGRHLAWPVFAVIAATAWYAARG